MSRRRDQDRTIDSDPATQGALSVPKTFEAPSDPAALHEEEDVERMLDREARSDDDADVHVHERPPIDATPDPQAVEELAGEAILLATQGGGSRRVDGEDSLEEQIDREAMEAGIVPQLVGQATLDSAAGTDDEATDAEEDAETLPRARPGRTAVRGRPSP